MASYPAKPDADKLVERLTRKGFEAYMIEADLPGRGHMFRVRVGNYPTHADAEEALKTFKTKSALPAIISNR